jgi:hypothetical protein
VSVPGLPHVGPTMTPVCARVYYAATVLGTCGALACWGALDLAARAYRIQRAARQLI